MKITTDGSLAVRTREGEVVVRITMLLVGDDDIDVLRSTSLVLNGKLVVGILMEESVGTGISVGVIL